MRGSWIASLRYVIGGALMVVAGFAALAFATPAETAQDAVVATADTPEQPTARPTPTPLATPTPGADAGVEAEATVAQEVANTGVASEGVTAEVTANPVEQEFYVPNFVAAGDRTATGTNRSVPLATPTPTPTPTPVPTPRPQPQPTPTPQPQPDPTPTAEPEPDPEPTATPTPEDDPGDGGSSDGPTAAQWEALRQCESGGDYTILNPSGLYRGAYQFSQSTWNWIAGAYYPELDGVDPAQAAPADQDKMAFKLYDVGGWQHWPVCGQHLL